MSLFARFAVNKVVQSLYSTKLHVQKSEIIMNEFFFHVA